jgi:hypothetical protein
MMRDFTGKLEAQRQGNKLKAKVAYMVHDYITTGTVDVL